MAGSVSSGSRDVDLADTATSVLSSATTVSRGAADFVPKACARVTRQQLSEHCGLGQQNEPPADVWGTCAGKVYNLTEFARVNESCGSSLLRKFGGGEFPYPTRAANAIECCFVGYLDSADVAADIASQGFASPPVYHDRERSVGAVDLSKPLVRQIYELSKQEYMELATEFICTTEPARFFVSPILEIFSRTKWWVIPLLWLPVAFGNLWCAHLFAGLGWSFIGACVLLGIFIWTFAEYCVHRFAFHFSEHYLPDYQAVRLLHFLVHSVHHLLPMDPMRLVMPPALAALFMSPFYLLSRIFVPADVRQPTWSGILIGYVAYDMLHYAEHHFPLHDVPYLGFMKRYHLKHHFRYPLLAFGVSSPLWDIVFGTTI